LARGQDPDFNDLTLVDKKAYIYGRAILDFLGTTQGVGSIKQFYDAMCYGQSEDAAAAKAFGKPLKAIYADALAYFRSPKTKKDLESHYLEWLSEGLYQVSRLEKSDSRRVETSELPTSLAQLKTVPNIFKAYQYDIQPFLKDFVGSLVGPEKEYIYVWATGVYQVTGKDFVATIHPDVVANHGCVIVKIGTHEITQWGNGQRKWRMPDGSYLVYWNSTQQGYFDANGKPIKL
jgi:hypothetical protein